MGKCLILADTPPWANGGPRYYLWSYVLVNISVLGGGHGCLMPMTWVGHWALRSSCIYSQRNQQFECLKLLYCMLLLVIIIYTQLGAIFAANNYFLHFWWIFAESLSHFWNAFLFFYHQYWCLLKNIIYWTHGSYKTYQICDNLCFFQYWTILSHSSFSDST